MNQFATAGCGRGSRFCRQIGDRLTANGLTAHGLLAGRCGIDGFEARLQ